MIDTTPQATLRSLSTILEQGDWAALEAHPGLYETRQHFPAMLAAFPDLRHTIELEVVAGEMIATVVHTIELEVVAGEMIATVVTARGTTLIDQYWCQRYHVVCQEPNAGAAGSVRNENQRLARPHRRCYRFITSTRRSAVSLGAVSPVGSVQRGVAR
jgi:hypothetical protein